MFIGHYAPAQILVYTNIYIKLYTVNQYYYLKKNGGRLESFYRRRRHRTGDKRSTYARNRIGKQKLQCETNIPPCLLHHLHPHRSPHTHTKNGRDSARKNQAPPSERKIRSNHSRPSSPREQQHQRRHRNGAVHPQHAISATQCQALALHHLVRVIFIRFRLFRGGCRWWRGCGGGSCCREHWGRSMRPSRARHADRGLGGGLHRGFPHFKHNFHVVGEAAATYPPVEVVTSRC